MTDYTKPISGKKLFESLKGTKGIVMAANIRISHSVRGIMQAAKEKNSAILFEIAKSEVGYTGQSPQIFMDNILKAAEELEFNQPYAVHADHITIKENTADAIKSAEDLIKAEIAAGFTSYAIDASHNFNVEADTELEQLADNIEITKKLAKLIPEGAGLEVEVGEVGRADPETGEKMLTSVDESVTFIKALEEDSIQPDLLAINNGTVHGNVYDEKGNIIALVGIDVEVTKAIADAIKPLGVRIAQHGITGTPFDMMHLLVDAGIAKGNVATHWQNIAVENMADELRGKLQQWTLASKQAAKMKAKKPKISEGELLGKNIKHSIKVFKDEIDRMDQEYVEKIIAATKKDALEFFDAFQAEGTADTVKAYLEK